MPIKMENQLGHTHSPDIFRGDWTTTATPPFLSRVPNHRRVQAAGEYLSCLIKSSGKAIYLARLGFLQSLRAPLFWAVRLEKQTCDS